MSLRETVERLLDQLPERHTAELLFERLLQAQPSLDRTFQRDKALLSDVLTLAAWSPLLATTLENYPDYIGWLQRERGDPRVRTCEELSESLARFALINSTVDTHVMLSRFRRRELLRTYLHDIRRTRTIVDTTEELSNLADAILDYALKLSRQHLDNRHGPPQAVDPQGRIITAEFCVMALGKLGSFELNYSSDIDLVFIYSENGLTAGGEGQVTNREYFVKLGERIMKFVSAQTGEGAAYRIDVRLRPHGRVSALACSLGEAVAYYEREARDWELQTLIRSRSSAGSPRLYAAFAEHVRDRVYRKDVSVAQALASVRTAKEQIELQRTRTEKGFNVKLGRGGIREIEFIAQALQIAHGGRDPWLRTTHTLITLGRLADRSLISKDEHSQLSDAYHFLRALEHRLQMEHGLQTHVLPEEAGRRTLVARRMNFSGDAALADFEYALNRHLENVRATFDRVFGPQPTVILAESRDLRLAAVSDPAETVANLLAKHVARDTSTATIAEMIRAGASKTLNPTRMWSLLTRIAGSLAKDDARPLLSEEEICELVKLCGVSEPFGEMIANRPALIHALPEAKRALPPRDFQNEIVTAESFAAQADNLRQAWYRTLLAIATRDVSGDMSLLEINGSLTTVACAAIDAALMIAERELARRYLNASRPRLAVLGLGRLASGGMDYGSDLDIVIVFDNEASSPVPELTIEEAYARFAELFLTAVSGVTLEGYLYRVDLRLRPDGQKGPLAAGSHSFLNYLQTRADIWEWLAHVNSRAVAGDLKLGQEIESQARDILHRLARQTDRKRLQSETRRVRERLEKERTGQRKKGGLNIKHAAGGMLDVYFAMRYLQLRDDVRNDGPDRSTLSCLTRLRERDSLDQRSFAQLHDGYALLRKVDHEARLIVGRSANIPLPEQSALRDIAQRLEFQGADDLMMELGTRMKGIRSAYERIMAE